MTDTTKCLLILPILKSISGVTSADLSGSENPAAQVQIFPSGIITAADTPILCWHYITRIVFFLVVFLGRFCTNPVHKGPANHFTGINGMVSKYCPT
jgi:hypothetical protein